MSHRYFFLQSLGAQKVARAAEGTDGAEDRGAQKLEASGHNFLQLKRLETTSLGHRYLSALTRERRVAQNLARGAGGTLPLLFALFNDLFFNKTSTSFGVVAMNGDYALFE